MTATPTWDQLMAPALRALLDGQVHRRRELHDLIAESEHLTAEQRSETLTSGQLRFENRVGWACSYLARVGAVERPSRGQYVITDLGRNLLAEHPDGITEKHLRALAGDANAPHTWYALKAMDKGDAVAPVADEPDLDPTEQIETGIARIHAEVAADLLSRLHSKEPMFFEHAVVKLLVAMGYGGADRQATVTSASNDGGIDGIIDQDTLGLNKVYVQAKRYSPR